MIDTGRIRVPAGMRMVRCERFSVVVHVLSDNRLRAIARLGKKRAEARGRVPAYRTTADKAIERVLDKVVARNHLVVVDEDRTRGELTLFEFGPLEVTEP